MNINFSRLLPGISLTNPNKVELARYGPRVRVRMREPMPRGVNGGSGDADGCRGQ